MENFRRKSGIKRSIIIVEDEMVNREILSNILQETYDVVKAENGKEALEKLGSGERKYSLVLLDLLMPVMDGFEFLENIKNDEMLKKIPVIVMTAEKQAEVKCIKLGAVDFITKPYDMPEVILARCERIIELSEDKSFIQSAERDALTGLYAKDFFMEYIRQIENFDNSRKTDAVVINIDHFHLFNELYGRKQGDRVLKKLAEFIHEALDEGKGLSCRSEADTFYIYCDHRDDYEGFIGMLQTQLDSLEFTNHIRIRAGVYQGVDNEAIVENRFDKATTAANNIRGDYIRNIAYYSKEVYERALYQERLIKDIDGAIANKDFMVYYQPKYGIQGDEPKLRSAEALVRWKHPELGMISPGDFIPLFESNGLVQRLDYFVWKEAASQIKKWKDEFGISVPVSVNVSRIDIFDPELENKILNLLEENDLEPGELMLEITESAYSENADRLIEVIGDFRAKGFKIEMDDFGSGYSSLNTLTTIPIDVLKLDMQFVRNMLKNEKNLKLVEIILDIAKFLEVPVVAEGVEDEEQLRILKERGCEVIQGYYFSKPVPPEEFTQFIIKEKGRIS